MSQIDKHVQFAQGTYKTLQKRGIMTFVTRSLSGEHRRYLSQMDGVYYLKKPEKVAAKPFMYQVYLGAGLELYCKDYGDMTPKQPDLLPVVEVIQQRRTGSYQAMFRCLQYRVTQPEPRFYSERKDCAETRYQGVYQVRKPEKRIVRAFVRNLVKPWGITMFDEGIHD